MNIIMKHNILFTAVLLASLSGTEVTSVAYGTDRFGYEMAAAFSDGSVSVGNIDFQTNSDGTAMVTGLSDKTASVADIPEKITYDGEEYTVTSIKMMAFGFSCKNLVTINIPSTVTEIQEFAFYGAPVLAEINVAEGNSAYSSSDGMLLSADGKELVICPSGKTGHAEIPDGTEVICESAFSGCKVQSVNMPSSVVSAGSNTFDNCTELEKVVLSESLTELPNYMFTYCGKLKDVQIPVGVHTIGEYAFNLCSSLEEVVIPGGVNTVKSSAFYKCSSLRKVTIGKAVSIIGSWAFEDCKLEEIYCNGTTPPTIDGSTAFKSVGYDVYNMATLYVPAGYADAYRSSGEWASFVNVEEFSNSGEVIVDNGLQYTINDNGKEVTLVGMDESCTQTDIVVPQDITYNNDLYRVVAVGAKAFYENKEINSIVLPRYSKTVADSAFFGSKVSAIEISERMDSIGRDAFAYCKNMKEFTVAPRNKKYVAEDGYLLSVDKDVLLAYPSAKADIYTVPENITSIGSSAFKGSDIKQIDLGNVSVIGESAFEDCFALQPVRLPVSTQQIDARAFAGCESDTIFVEAYTPPMLGADAFDGMYESVVVVPAGCFMTYMMAEGWYQFANMVEEQFEAPETVEEDGYTYYKIEEADDLYWFAKAVNDGQVDINAILANNIVINDMQFDEDGTPVNASILRPWKPVGAKPNAFSGIFDGRGYCIEGIYINDEYGSRSGFFSEVASSGKVVDVTVKNAYVRAYNCFGAVCGYNDGIIESCRTEGIVHLVSTDPSALSAGAVCGSNFAGVIKNSSNAAEVVADGVMYVGAICGDNYGTIKTSNNEGFVVASGNAAGICGYTDNGKIENCYNLGTVSGSGESGNGGIVVYMNSASVSNSYSYGAIEASVPEKACPIYVEFLSSAVENCYYLEGSASSAITDNAVKAMTRDQFANGEVAHMLQGSQAENVWGQTLDKDTVPVIYNENRVFRIELDNEGDVETIYANSGNIKLPEPERANYEFLGWFDDKAEGTQYHKDSALNKDMTLYARWQKIGISDTESGCWCRSTDGCIIVEGEFTNVTVFRADGTKVYIGNERVIHCGDGLYIVKIDNICINKVVVK